jgi:hypothetical protein
MSFTAEEIFDKWVGIIQDDAALRYLGVNRKPVLDELAKMLFSSNVDYSEAKMLSRQVVNKLTTEEGRKGKDKYKGWTQAVTDDFRVALATYYVECDTTNASKNVINVEAKVPISNKIPEDALITAWCRNRFGERWNDRVNQMAHQIGHALNLQFMTDVFESEWGNNLELAPEWYKQLRS